MELTWQKSESLTAPLAVDTTLSKNLIYIRKNIEVSEIEGADGKKVNKYTYDETTITPAEYNALGDNSARVLYELALNTPVTYTNGHVYKPNYIEDYLNEINAIKAPLELVKLAGGDVSKTLPDISTITVNVYDATRKSENKEVMTLSDLVALYYFLFLKKEELYNAYRAQLDAVL